MAMVVKESSRQLSALSAQLSSRLALSEWLMPWWLMMPRSEMLRGVGGVIALSLQLCLSRSGLPRMS
jgi:hypothetical protein